MKHTLKSPKSCAKKLAMSPVTNKKNLPSLPPKRRLVGVVSCRPVWTNIVSSIIREKISCIQSCFFLKHPKTKNLPRFFALVEVMHLEYRAVKDNNNVGMYNDKAMKEVSQVEDPSARNFLTALVAHIYLAMDNG